MVVGVMITMGISTEQEATEPNKWTNNSASVLASTTETPTTTTATTTITATTTTTATATMLTTALDLDQW